MTPRSVKEQEMASGCRPFVDGRRRDAKLEGA